MSAPTGLRPAARTTITGSPQQRLSPDTTASMKMENATWP